MSRPVLRIHFRTMALATESADRVRQALAFASGCDDITTTKAEGHFGNPITVMEAELTRKGEIGLFLERLREAGIPAAVSGTLDERIDDDCVLHLRLDKQAAYLGELALASDRDVIDIGLKVAAYPADPEKARRAVREWAGQ